MTERGGRLARPDRRVVVTGLAAGLALAAQPAAATEVVTSDDGLDAGPIQVPAPGGPLPGYQARPKGGTDLPVVLVVQEIFGLHAHIRDVCRRLARQGWLACSVELFARHGDVSKLTDIQQVLGVVAKVPDAEVLADLDALAAWAGAHGGDVDRMGITGFCWGGRIVWLYAAHRSGLKAGVAWYGRLRGQADPLHPRHPLDVVPELQAPVLGLYGGKDGGIPVADVDAMRAALAAAGRPGELVVYPEASHAFHADYRPSYRAEDAADGARRMAAWFRAHGAA
ncbi:MAG: dienelactone hydrolase family protein [Alphaproteobacteria bacterium]|nr:dienelactone hydrolase family protein [Alphaproteobacteria bacterium]